MALRAGILDGHEGALGGLGVASPQGLLQGRPVDGGSGGHGDEQLVQLSLSIAEESGKSANALYKLLGRLREKLSVCIHKNLKPQTC